MRVIITGGTGLIGRALTASLAADGHEAVVLSRNRRQVTGLPAGVRVEGWDTQTPAGWGALVDGAEAVVNLAGENLSAWLWTDAQKERIRASRLNAGRAVVQAIEAAAHKPRVVVQASGVGYYGSHGDEELTEDDEPGQGFLPELAVEWENVTLPVEELGVRRVIVRSGGVLSGDGGLLPKALIPFRLFAGGPVGSGKQWVPWIHIADEVRAIRFLLEREEARGPFNLVSPQPVTNADFGKALARAVGRPFLMPAPAFAVRAALGELSSVILEGQRALPKRLSELGFTFQFESINSSLQDLLG